MRVCLMIEGQEGVSWDEWLALANACERAGLEGLFRSDHYLPIVRGGATGSLDAWTTLAALAARTERIRLGTLVSPVTFRHPAVLGKSAASANEIAGGRVELGIGAGWYEAEHEHFGIPFPSVRERMDELDRHLAELDRLREEPRPHLIVGGSAKPRTVAAAVRHADEYNTVFATPDECRERRARLDAACHEAGREPLVVSLMTGCVVGADEQDVARRVARFRELTGREPGGPTVVGTVEQAAERLREYEAVGVERVMLQHVAHEDVEMVDVLGELSRAIA